MPRGAPFDPRWVLCARIRRLRLEEVGFDPRRDGSLGPGRCECSVRVCDSLDGPMGFGRRSAWSGNQWSLSAKIRSPSQQMRSLKAAIRTIW